MFLLVCLLLLICLSWFVLWRCFFFFFKQKTAYEMRISDWSSDVCSSDLLLAAPMIAHPIFHLLGVTDGGNIGSGAAVLVIGVYILFGLIALAIDRRALLVSALAYVLFEIGRAHV